MPPKLDPETEMLAAHMAAVTAAFQVLILGLERTGVFEKGDYAGMLDVYIERQNDKHPEVVLALLDDLRRALMH